MHVGESSHGYRLFVLDAPALTFSGCTPRPTQLDAVAPSLYHMQRFGTEMMYRDVSSVDLSSRPFRVSVRKREFFAK